MRDIAYFRHRSSILYSCHQRGTTVVTHEIREIRFSYAILDQKIQINGGCLEAAGPYREKIRNGLVRALIVSPHR